MSANVSEITAYSQKIWNQISLHVRTCSCSSQRMAEDVFVFTHMLATLSQTLHPPSGYALMVVNLILLSIDPLSVLSGIPSAIFLGTEG